MSYPDNVHMEHSPTTFDLAVVGGGAAGFFAAIACGMQAGKRLPRTVILEKARQPLAKVLISGGGRCNVTHACYDPDRLVTFYPRGGAALRVAFTRFQPKDTVRWFESRGVWLKTEPDGRIFPVSDRSQEIADCLQQAALEFGVAVWTQVGVVSITHTGSVNAPYQITARINRGSSKEHTETIHARHILLATGGEPDGMALAASLGHSIIPPVPSLFTFKIPDPRLADLAGLSVQQASVQLLEPSNAPAEGAPGNEQTGPVLITHWGLSGPAILRLSAWGARWLNARQYQARLQVNWLYPQKKEQVLQTLEAAKNTTTSGRKQVMTQCPFAPVPQRLWRRLVESAEIGDHQRWAEVSKARLSRLAEELTAGKYLVEGKGPFKEEFVTCGGVPLDEVDFKTMESRLLPGLYFAGEILDVDGLTGGFNFQNAWTTGWLAGSAIKNSLTRSTN